MALLQYDIRVIGKETVDRALAGIEARIRQHNQRVGQMTGMSAVETRRAASPHAATQSAARFRSSASAQFKGVDREKKAAARAEATLAKSADRDKAKSLREEYRIKNAINNMNLRQIAQEDRLKLRAATRDQRIIDRQAKARSAFVQSTLGHGFDRASRTVKAVGVAGAAMLGIGGAGLAASAVGGAISMDERARRLLVAGRGPGQDTTTTPDELRKSLTQTGLAHGIDTGEVTGAAEKFVEKTGDLTRALKFSDTFATAAQAAGASMTDIASIGAEMSKKFNIQTAEDMQQAFAQMIFQGKKNAFVLKDMAPLLTEIMAGMKGQAGLQGVEGMKTVGGLMQMAKEGTGSPEAAATALENVLKQLVAKSDVIKEDTGVDVFEKRAPGDTGPTPMRDLKKIIPEMVAAVKGDIVKLNDIFEIRGSRAFNPISGAYRIAYGEAKGTPKEKEAAANEAVAKQLEFFVEAKGASWVEVQKDEGAAMKSFSVQLEQGTTMLKRAMAEQLLPEVVKLIPVIAELTPYVGQATKMFVELVKFLLDHPFGSLAIVVAGQLAADFAAAKLGSLVGGLITKAFTAVGNRIGGRPSLGKVGGAGDESFLRNDQGSVLRNTSGAGVMGAVGAGAALGITVGSAIIAANVVNFERGEVEMKKSGSLLNQVRDMNAPEEAGKARALVEEQRAKVNEIHKKGLLESTFSLFGDDFGRGAAQMFGAAPSDAETKTQESFLKEMEDRLKKLDDLNDAAQKMKAAGESQEATAKQLAEMAKRMGLQPLNRSNTPSSPITGSG